MGPGWVGISADEIEVGVIVHPTHRNRGIATEATDLVAVDCFTRVGLNRLVALTTIDNKPSLRTLEKLGMRHRGETQQERDHTTYELFELARPARQP
jgi:RimJ/RimL family protein N-acetyltransferase